MNKCSNVKSLDGSSILENVKYFTQYICEEKILVTKGKPDVDHVTSVIVDSEIISLRIINTPVGCSEEGQKLTGKKLSIEIKLRQKLVYVSQTAEQSIHVLENEYYKSVAIVVPQFIYGSKVENLISHNYLKVNIEVENTSVTKIDNRIIYLGIALFAKLQVRPSYLLCFAEDNSRNNSRLFICYKDGSQKKEIACYEEGQVIMPQWSPCGQKIAYILKREDSSFLCLSDINGNNTYALTDSEVFKYVSGFSWYPDNTSIVFTAFFKNNKDIFLINLNKVQWKQLTYGRSEYKSIKPKCSFDGEYIAYIRSNSDERSLYVMERSGLNNRHIKNLSKVKDFCWENNKFKLVAACHKSEECNSKEDYMLGRENNGDEIFLVDVKYNEILCINIAKLKLKIKKIKVSYDNRYISFVGERLGLQDIYLFDKLKNQIINLTENTNHVIISDYDWNKDGSEIYYSCNELHFYNIYCVNIRDKVKAQISNTRANNIKISFRPKIL